MWQIRKFRLAFICTLNQPIYEHNNVPANECTADSYGIELESATYVIEWMKMFWNLLVRRMNKFDRFSSRFSENKVYELPQCWYIRIYMNFRKKSARIGSHDLPKNPAWILNEQSTLSYCKFPPTSVVARHLPCGGWSMGKSETTERYCAFRCLGFRQGNCRKYYFSWYLVILKYFRIFRRHLARIK